MNVQLQGFTADNIFGVDAVTIAETSMGIDGILSGGFVHSITKQKIHLRPNSESVGVFETWYSMSEQAQDVYKASAMVTLPATGKSYSLKGGILRTVKLIPDPAKTLKDHEFEVDWESVRMGPS